MKLRMLKPRLKALNPATNVVKPTTSRISGTSNQLRRQRLLSKEPLCRHCLAVDRIVAARVLDHVIPLWEGGPDTDSNLQPLCQRCHDAKSAEEARRRYRGTGNS